MDISDIILSPDKQKEFCELLRKETGCAIMDCKKALVKNNWDMNKSLEWLNDYFNSSCFIF